jgi:hypothetical protein
VSLAVYVTTVEARVTHQVYVLTTTVVRPDTVTAEDPVAPVADAVPVQPVTWMLTVAESDMGVPESVGVTVAVFVACRIQQQQGSTWDGKVWWVQFSI